jgi:hypothetical protein
LNQCQRQQPHHMRPSNQTSSDRNLPILRPLIEQGHSGLQPRSQPYPDQHRTTTSSRPPANKSTEFPPSLQKPSVPRPADLAGYAGSGSAAGLPASVSSQNAGRSERGKLGSAVSSQNLYPSGPSTNSLAHSRATLSKSQPEIPNAGNNPNVAAPMAKGGGAPVTVGGTPTTRPISAVTLSQSVSNVAASVRGDSSLERDTRSDSTRKSDAIRAGHSGVLNTNGSIGSGSVSGPSYVFSGLNPLIALRLDGQLEDEDIYV